MSGPNMRVRVIRAAVGLLGACLSLVLVLVLGVGSGAGAGPPASAARAPKPLETLTVDPNSAAWATGHVYLEAGKPYTLLVTGTAAYTSNPNEKWDALYCYEGCGKLERRGFLRLRTPGWNPNPPYGNAYYPIDAFQKSTPDPNCQPGICAEGLGYEQYHDYTVTFYPPTSGALEAGAPDQFLQQYFGPNVYATGSQLRVNIYEGLINPSNGCSRGQDSDAPAHAAAINEVHVVKVQPDVQFHKGGTPSDAWLPVEVNTVLKQGDEITTDPDGEVVLAFADNSTVNVYDTTQLKIGSFFTEGGVVRTEVLLAMGRVAACVNKSAATKSDFRIKSPTATISVRGTIFSVFYDPGSGTTVVSTQRGSVLDTPANPRLRPVPVGVGREVEVTKSYESPLAAIGKAGARGGVDIVHARDLVLALIAKHNRACGASTPRSHAYSIAPARGGWIVTVVLIGRLHGRSAWAVTNHRARPANRLAKTLARGCR